MSRLAERELRRRRRGSRPRSRRRRSRPGPLPGTSSSSRSIAPVLTSTPAAASTTPSASWACASATSSYSGSRSRKSAWKRPRRSRADVPPSALARCHATPGSTSSSTVKACRATSSRVGPARTAPPPSATTAGSAAPSDRGGDGRLSLPERRLRRPGRRAPRSSTPACRSISVSRSTNGRPSRRATSAPSVVFPAPMKPASARCRFRAFAATGCARGRRGAPRRSRRSRRRRTCPSRCGRAPTPRPPRQRLRAPRPPARPTRSTSACAGSPVSRSTESSGFISVGSGFIAARTTTVLAVRHSRLEAAGAVRPADEPWFDLVVRLRAAHALRARSRRRPRRP